MTEKHDAAPARQAEVCSAPQPTAPEEPLAFVRRESGARFTATATARAPGHAFFYIARAEGDNVVVDVNGDIAGIRLWLTRTQARALAREMLQAADFQPKEQTND